MHARTPLKLSLNAERKIDYGSANVYGQERFGLARDDFQTNEL